MQLHGEDISRGRVRQQSCSSCSGHQGESKESKTKLNQEKTRLLRRDIKARLKKVRRKVKPRGDTDAEERHQGKIKESEERS